MLRSMYSGISGMKNFQTKLDVIGNNISNVNTSGFKKGRATFQDMFSQMTAGAQASTGERGGVNPTQVGLGSQLGSIDNIHTQGFMQPTGRPLDLAIEGDGMFVVDTGDGGEAFTRDGSFYLDEEGFIVTSDGYYLLDADGENIEIPESAKDFSIGSDGTVEYTDENNEPVVAGQIGLTSFSNPEGLQKMGGNLYQDSLNAGMNGIQVPESDGVGSIKGSTLEMSNVDLAEEFTDMITAQRSFQANTRIINTSDEILQELVNLKRG